MKRTLSTLAALAATILLAPLARAHTTYDCNGSPSTWFGGAPTFAVNDISFPPGSTGDKRVRSMMSRWNGIARCAFAYNVSRDTDGTVSSGNGQNEVYVTPIDGVGGTLAITMNHFSACLFGMAIVESDVYFDSAETWSGVAAPSPSQVMSTTNLSLTALHEFGHALGLDHESDMADTMNPYYPFAGTLGPDRVVTTHADSRNGARLLYPQSGDSIREYTLSNWKRLSSGATDLISTPSSATRGSTITMEFTMENTGTTTNSPVVGHFLSLNSTITTNDIRIGTSSGVSMSRGKVRTRSASVTIPSDVAPGTYYLGSIIDVNNTLVEADEANNWLPAPRQITIY